MLDRRGWAAELPLHRAIPKRPNQLRFEIGFQGYGHVARGLVNRRNAQSVSGNVFLKFLQFVHKNVFDSFFLRFGLRFQYVFVVPAFFLTFSSSRGRF